MKPLRSLRKFPVRESERWKCGLCGNEYPRDVVIACPSCVFSLDGVDTALAGAKS